MGDFFDTYFPHAQDNLFSAFGETVTYRARGAASGSSINARRILGGSSGRTDGEISQPLQWLVDSADVSSPQKGDKITVSSGEVYTVRDAEPDKAGSFLLTATTSKN